MEEILMNLVRALSLARELCVTDEEKQEFDDTLADIISQSAESPQHYEMEAWRSSK